MTHPNEARAMELVEAREVGYAEGRLAGIEEAEKIARDNAKKHGTYMCDMGCCDDSENIADEISKLKEVKP